MRSINYRYYEYLYCKLLCLFLFIVWLWKLSVGTFSPTIRVHPTWIRVYMLCKLKMGHQLDTSINPKYRKQVGGGASWGLTLGPGRSPRRWGKLTLSIVFISRSSNSENFRRIYISYKMNIHAPPRRRIVDHLKNIYQIIEWSCIIFEDGLHQLPKPSRRKSLV